MLSVPLWGPGAINHSPVMGFLTPSSRPMLVLPSFLSVNGSPLHLAYFVPFTPHSTVSTDAYLTRFSVSSLLRLRMALTGRKIVTAQQSLASHTETAVPTCLAPRRPYRPRRLPPTQSQH